MNISMLDSRSAVQARLGTFQQEKGIKPLKDNKEALHSVSNIQPETIAEVDISEIARSINSDQSSSELLLQAHTGLDLSRALSLLAE